VRQQEEDKEQDELSSYMGSVPDPRIELMLCY